MSELERENARLRGLLDEIHRGDSVPPPAPKRYDQAILSYEARKAETGKARAASANWRNVQLARECAKEAFLELRRPISADDVRDYMSRRFPDTVYGNWMGSIWERGVWRQVGFTKSDTKGSHGNLLRTWVMR